MSQPNYASETQILRGVIAKDCRWRYTDHALEQMVARGISAPDVEFALTNGQVTLHEQKKDELWRVEGRDLDGRRLKVIVAVYEEAIEIKVITAF